MNHAERYLRDLLTELKDKLRGIDEQEVTFLKVQSDARTDLKAKIADLEEAVDKLTPAKPAAKKTAAKKAGS
jgi:hypothetical protein